jgi:hypothetical protein
MSRKAYSAASIFHIRRWLARHGFASHARGRWLCTDCGRQFDPVERPLSDQHDNNVSIFSGMRNSSNPGDMDARRDVPPFAVPIAV